MGDVNWRRTFAISSLIFALLLVCGSIYLHLQQKHHLGRLRHTDKVIIPISGVDATPDVNLALSAVNDNKKKVGDATSIDYFNEYFTDRQGENSSEESVKSDDFEIFNENHKTIRKLLSEGVAAPPSSPEIPPELTEKHIQISEVCLQCICETITGCQPAICADNEPCGVFRISRPYWIDGGRLRLDGDRSGPKEQGPNADYSNCVNNAFCAARTIGGFVNKYTRDCNGDGKIDCQDFIALHVLGPSGCRMTTLSSVFSMRMDQCLLKFS